MAGHSHSKNVKIRKQAVDAKRSRIFGKMSRLIIMAARAGGGDPKHNAKLAFAINNPSDELTLPFKKLFWLYYNDEEGLKWNEGHGGQAFLNGGVRETLLGLSNVYYFSVLALFLLGVPLWFARGHPGRLLLVSLAAYWTLVHLVFFGDPRFHAPIMPVVALLAALPLVAIGSGRAPWSGSS